MRGEREIRPKWPAIYTFLGRGKRWQPSNKFGVWWSNKFGCLVVEQIRWFISNPILLALARMSSAFCFLFASCFVLEIASTCWWLIITCWFATGTSKGVSRGSSDTSRDGYNSDTVMPRTLSKHTTIRHPYHKYCCCLGQFCEPWFSYQIVSQHTNLHQQVQRSYSETRCSILTIQTLEYNHHTSNRIQCKGATYLAQFPYQVWWHTATTVQPFQSWFLPFCHRSGFCYCSRFACTWLSLTDFKTQYSVMIERRHIQDTPIWLATKHIQEILQRSRNTRLC
jgi:hypothetical protein